MTCIVGMIEKGYVWLGGDSCAADEGSAYEVRSAPKVFAKGSMLIGACGSIRILQVVQHTMHQPAHPKGWSTMKYLVNAWVPALRKSLMDGGVIPKDEDAVLPDSGLLLGYRGELFTVEDDGHIGQTDLPYASVGSGTHLALASLCQQEILNDQRPAKQRLINALEIAEAHVMNVRGPFTIISTVKQE